MSFINFDWYKKTLDVLSKRFDTKADLVNGKVPAEQIARPDFTENNPDSPSYIEGRTHYIDGVKTVSKTDYLVSNAYIYVDNEGQPVVDPFKISFIVGDKYTILFNGVEYECEAYIAAVPGTPSIGNGIIGEADEKNSGEPFFCTVFDGQVLFFTSEAGSHNVSIIRNYTTLEENIHKIDRKYVDWPFGEPTKKVVPFYDATGFVVDYNFEFIPSTLPNGKLGYVCPEAFYFYASDLHNSIIHVSWDGTVYSLKATCIETGSDPYFEFGDINFVEYPFYFITSHNYYELVHICTNDTSNTHRVIVGFSLINDVTKIDSSYVDNLVGRITNFHNHSEIFNDYEYNIASGDYSHAEGVETKATGNGSHAEGSGTMASGAYGAHAEGNLSKAIGDSSHSEGVAAIAYGSASHAEGQSTVAHGEYSHAEGTNTIAIGRGSHSEGVGKTVSAKLKGDAGATVYTNTYSMKDIKVGQYITFKGNISKIIKIDGTTITVDKTLSEDDELTGSSFLQTIYIGGIAESQSHTEGNNTIATGSTSHAEGSGTIALGGAQHVQGRYNIEDSSSTYAHIVGNGDFKWTGTNSYKITRSNAHTLDWDGTAWFQGDVYVGSTSGTNRDEGSKKLATTDDIETAISVDETELTTMLEEVLV